MNLNWMQHAIPSSENTDKNALNTSSRNVEEGAKKAKKRTLRIIVRSHDGDKVNINLPISLGLSVLKKGSKHISINSNVLDQLDFDDIETLIEEGAVGEIANVESHEGDTVKIVID